MTKILVLLSGGLDSSTCATIACDEVGAENVVALSVYYGQRHASEIMSAKKVCGALEISKHIAISLPASIYAEADCALTNEKIAVPEITYEELIKKNELSPLYVPFRNGVLLSVATAVALQHGCSLIYYGAHSEDNQTWAYPDCSPEFIDSMCEAINFGTGGKVDLVAPLQTFTKKEIVAKALRIKVPLKYTYSCYNGGNKSCGKCPTCISRIAAFKANAVKDPIEYEIPIDWLGGNH